MYYKPQEALGYTCWEQPKKGAAEFVLIHP